MKPSVTPSDVRALLGEVDDLVLERLLQTGATVDELEEAIADVREERDSGRFHVPSSSCVALLREILDEIFDEPVDDDSFVRAQD